MSPHNRRLLGSLLLVLSGMTQAQGDNLTDFERFRSYPYLDRSYREAQKGNWKEVERLTRHLLQQVPKNQEAQGLLAQSLAKQRRYKDAMQAMQSIDADSEALLELRLTWIEQDPPEPRQVESWIDSSSLPHRIRLWQAYSMNLAKFGGAARAHEWLTQLPAKGDDSQLRLARASWSEQLHNWDDVITELEPVAALKQLDAQAWQRLANAYMQRLDEAKLEALLQQAPDPQAAHQLHVAMIERAIALGHRAQAQRWIQRLSPQEQADPVLRVQHWELARQENDSATVQRLSAELQRPCLETAEWLSRHDPEAALKQLRGCSSQDDPQSWLILAQRLQARDLLQSQRLPEPWDSARRDRLLEVWHEQGKDAQALNWLSQQEQTPAVLKKRAELLQAQGRTREAAGIWERQYRQSGNLTALDQATFLAIGNGQEIHAQALLEQAYDHHNGRLPTPLLQRLAGLYAASSSLNPAQLQRMATLIQRVDPSTRGQLLAQLAERGHCDAVQQAIGQQPQAAGEYHALGRCAMPAQPGAAVAYYQAAERLGDPSSRLPLAYALEASGDSAAALAIWNSVPGEQLSDNARLTASRSALSVGDPASAERYWQQSRARTADEWALGAAIAEQRGDYAGALARQRMALRQAPNPGHFYAASVTAQKAGDLQQSTQWLAEAVHLTPDNPRFRADYGMRLAAGDTPQQRRQAIAYLQQATRDFPEDYRLGETLALRYDEIEDSAAARKELRRVIDLEQHPVAADDESGSLQARRYRQRRAHETLSRRDSVTIASTWSPAGVSTNNSLLPNGNTQGTRSPQSQNVQVAMWDHALGDEPSRNGSTLSVYGRTLLGGTGRSSYGESAAAGLGLRYKPWGDANINFYGELYKQNQFNEQDSHGLSLGQMLDPGRLLDQLNDHRKRGQTSTDYLLRTTASFLDQGQYRNDWRIDERDWNERFLYLDASWFTKSAYHLWLSRYQQGHTWKLPVDTAQTIMPYGFVEFAAQDPQHDWRQDLRTGIGLRWQYWFNDDKYNAYRAHLTVRTEYQQSLGGNLYEGGNGVLLGVELNF
ncbi:NfrA family protein [Pseudomonas fluorescens]|uniref:NfrA family protein n=1 Tax=Pseudomonas fluorescens TaxID=294 RepID=UPI0006425832|nr:bacteriophage N4 receptor, outer membrane subunit [Pseudomonas fluorescens]